MSISSHFDSNEGGEGFKSKVSYSVCGVLSVSQNLKKKSGRQVRRMTMKQRGINNEKITDLRVKKLLMATVEACNVNP